MSCDNTVYEQTLFLGCSIQSFQCSLGYNEQPSTLSAELVRDDCEGDPLNPKVFYNDALNRITTTAPDPGFDYYGADGPTIGAPVFFKFSDFEFCGILQSWEKTNVGSDKDTYQVTLVSPTEILRGIQLILGEYSGSVRGFNIFNIFGAQEYLQRVCFNDCGTFSQNATDGVMFGSLADGYGGSDYNEGGMPWRLVRQAISILTANSIRVFGKLDDFSQYGRASFIGAPISGYGMLPNDGQTPFTGGYSRFVSEYAVDVEDVLTADPDYRIGTDQTDLLSLISQVTRENVQDYFIELVPVKALNGIVKVLKVRTISRVDQPTQNAIQSYINDQVNEEKVISATYGRELRNESATNFVVGGFKRSLYQIDNGIPNWQIDPDIDYINTFGEEFRAYLRDTVVPFFGLDTEGNLHPVVNKYVEHDSKPGVFLPAGHDVTIDLRGIKDTFQVISPYLSDTITVHTSFLASCYQGPDKAVYYAAFYSTTAIGMLLQSIASAEDLAAEGLAPFRNAALSPGSRARDLLVFHNSQILDTVIGEDFKILAEFFANIYETSLTTFMVRLPHTCAKYNEGRIETTDIGAEGAWTEASTILGLDNPSGSVDLFKKEDGSVGGIARFSLPNYYSLDFSNLKGIKHLYEGSTFYCEIEDVGDIVFPVKSSGRSPRVLITIPDLSSLDEDIESQFKFAFTPPIPTNSPEVAGANVPLVNRDVLANFAPGAIKDNPRDAEEELARLSPIPYAPVPISVAVPMESTVNKYGPWKPNNVIESGPPGQINMISDDSIVPWTYGSFARMNSIAQARANAGVGGFQAGETGSIRIAGLPELPLGTELLSIGEPENYFATRTAEYIQNFTVCGLYNTIYLNYGAMTGSNGPNVTSISVSINPDQGVTTTYNFRTYSRRFGILAKATSDQIAARLKEINRLEARLRMRNSARRIQQSNNRKVQKLAKELKKRKWRSD